MNPASFRCRGCGDRCPFEHQCEACCLCPSCCKCPEVESRLPVEQLLPISAGALGIVEVLPP